MCRSKATPWERASPPFPAPGKVIQRIWPFSGEIPANSDLSFECFMFLFFFGAVDAETALYTELWRACAGPLVTAPREGELVFYFPQGHIEQVSFQIPTPVNHFWSSLLDSS